MQSNDFSPKFLYTHIKLTNCMIELLLQIIISKNINKYIFGQENSPFTSCPIPQLFLESSTDHKQKSLIKKRIKPFFCILQSRLDMKKISTASGRVLSWADQMNMDKRSKFLRLLIVGLLVCSPPPQTSYTTIFLQLPQKMTKYLSFLLDSFLEWRF